MFILFAFGFSPILHRRHTKTPSGALDLTAWGRMNSEGLWSGCVKSCVTVARADADNTAHPLAPATGTSTAHNTTAVGNVIVEVGQFTSSTRASRIIRSVITLRTRSHTTGNIIQLLSICSRRSRCVVLAIACRRMLMTSAVHRAFSRSGRTYQRVLALPRHCHRGGPST